MFYRDGLHSVGVDAIATAAHTNKMTLYRHFGSKDQLIAAYIQQLADEGDALWLAIEAAHPDDPQARLQTWLDTVDQRLKESGARGCAIANAAVELPATHPARPIIENYKLRKRDRLMRLLNDAGYAAPEQLADEIFLMFEGAQISMQCAGKSGPASRLIHMVRALLSTARPA
jgi:AcrR family transcriptional regulator